MVGSGPEMFVFCRIWMWRTLKRFVFLCKLHGILNKCILMCWKASDQTNQVAKHLWVSQLSGISWHMDISGSNPTVCAHSTCVTMPGHVLNTQFRVLFWGTRGCAVALGRDSPSSGLYFSEFSLTRQFWKLKASKKKKQRPSTWKYIQVVPSSTNRESTS